MAASYHSIRTYQRDEPPMEFVDVEGAEVRNLLLNPGSSPAEEDDPSRGTTWMPVFKVSSFLLVVAGLLLAFFYGHGTHLEWKRSPTHLKAVISHKLQDAMKELHLSLEALNKSSNGSHVRHSLPHAYRGSNSSQSSKSSSETHVDHSSHSTHSAHSSHPDHSSHPVHSNHPVHYSHHSSHPDPSSHSSDPVGCHTAQPGEPCYEAVLWHKWVGVVENPTWYKNISRESNRHDIQRFLAQTRQGTCKLPCSGAYPVPHPAAPSKHEDPKAPKVYCFSVSRGGAEMDTMFLQRQTGGGIFGCDAFDVFSDQEIDIDGYKTKKIPSTASGVSVDGTAANSQVFLKTWMAILNSNTWWHYDFIAKVDPDAILYADRLRGHLRWHVGQNVFFLNCAKYIPATMYGALEVFSKAALGAYLSQHHKCEHSLPFWSWGEDRYMAGCLEMLGVKTQPDYLNFLHDERCWGVDCGNKAAVAFHSFKQVNHWYRCYEASK